MTNLIMASADDTKREPFLTNLLDEENKKCDRYSTVQLLRLGNKLSR
jgi:hypothetical protein